MAFTPPPLVTAPEPRGTRYGLLTAAAGPLELPTHGRAGGVQYDPVSCGHARLYPVECGEETPTAKTFDTGDAIVVADPFVVYSTYVCGSAGYTGAELETKVLRRLANGEQGAAEQALAVELAAAAVPLVAPDPTSIVAVVGELEQWLYGDAGAQYGNVGYLHAPARIAAYAQAEHQLVRDGPLWRTPMGTVWVFGAYPDDGTVYATGHVTVWRSMEPWVSPAAQVLDRSTNQYALVAEREYAVAYDCVVGAATFDTGGVS